MANIFKTFFLLCLFFCSSISIAKNKIQNPVWAQWSDLEIGLKFVLGQNICFTSEGSNSQTEVCQREGEPLFIQSLSGGMGVPLMIFTATSDQCSRPNFTSEESLVLPIAASPGRDRRVIVQYGPQCLWTVWVEVYDFYDFSFLRWPGY